MTPDDTVVRIADFKRRADSDNCLKLDFAIRDAIGRLGAEGATVPAIAGALLWHAVRAARVTGATTKEVRASFAEMLGAFDDDPAHGTFWTQDWLASGGGTAGVDPAWLPEQEPEFSID